VPRIARSPRLSIFLLVVLLLTSAGTSHGDPPSHSHPSHGTIKAHPPEHGGREQAVPTERWYVSKMTHQHHEMPADAHPHPRSWELEGEVDPAAIEGYQEMHEVTRYPHADRPTAEQQRHADELVRKCRESAERHGWFDFEQATKDGFKLMYGDLTHHVNEAYVLDDKILDPDRPEFVMFYDTPFGKRLAAFMFLARTPTERGPQIGGPLTVWHSHVWPKPKCLLGKVLLVGEPDQNGRCARGESGHRSPEMLHVWFIDHPHGPFATHMTLSREMRKQLERPDWPPPLAVQ